MTGKKKECTVLLKMSELYSDGIIGREMQFMVSGLLSMKKNIAISHFTCQGV